MYIELGIPTVIEAPAPSGSYHAFTAKFQHGGLFSEEELGVPRYDGKTYAERFWDCVHKTEGCWTWRRSRSVQGYGAFFMHGRYWVASRASWVISYGPIPNGLWVLHKCDNPSCVRPDHLFLGNQFDNMRDCAAKGRVGGGPKTKPNCRRGHFKGGQPKCRICNAARMRRVRQAKKIEEMTRAR